MSRARCYCRSSRPDDLISHVLLTDGEFIDTTLFIWTVKLDIFLFNINLPFMMRVAEVPPGGVAFAVVGQSLLSSSAP